MTVEATLDPQASAACAEAIVRRSGTSFFWGMRLLPRPRRQAMYAVYAFCRTVDDIADRPGDERGRQAELDGWRAELDRLYDGGRPTEPVAAALQPAIRRYGLPKAEFQAVIDGMESDLLRHNVAPSLAALRLYCRRVAGAVGLLSIRCFGADEPDAEPLAVALGEALQLTNILRDLGEDAAVGRLYLPQELLHRHGILERDPARAIADPRLPAVCADLARLARQRYAEARQLLAGCDRRRLRPALLMMARYEVLLDRLERAGWHDPSRRIAVPKWRSLWLLLRHLIA